MERFSRQKRPKTRKKPMKWPKNGLSLEKTAKNGPRIGDFRTFLGGRYLSFFLRLWLYDWDMSCAPKQNALLANVRQAPTLLPSISALLPLLST